jgi:integrase
MLKETIIKKQKGKEVFYTLVTTPKKKLSKYPPIYSYITRGKTRYKCFSIREEGLNTKASADTIEELLKQIDKIIFEHRNGLRLVVSRDSNPTVEEYFVNWIENIYEFDRTRKQTKSRFNTKVTPYIGHYKLKNLNHERLFRAFKKMFEDNKKYKFNQHIIVWTSTLKQMLDHALESKLIHENYMNNSVYKSYKKNNWYEHTGTINQYEPEEINVMLKGFEQASKLDYNQQLMITYIMVLLFTGLRRSEATGLRWKDIC